MQPWESKCYFVLIITNTIKEVLTELNCVVCHVVLDFIICIYMFFLTFRLPYLTMQSAKNNVSWFHKASRQVSHVFVSQCEGTVLYVLSVCMSKDPFKIIVDDGKAPAGFFKKRLSEKSLPAASHRNSEMPNQHFVIGIRKLHPLCNNMFLFGAWPNGSLPM